MTASTTQPVARASVPVKLIGIVVAGAAVSVALERRLGEILGERHVQPA